MGKLIGKYRIIKEIGNGNMGEVYLVLDENTDKKYAMKIAYKTEDSFFTNALKTEFELMKHLSLRRIPYVIDYGEEETLAYMIMEYVEGSSLEEYISKNAPLSVKESLSLISQICEILEYLHSLSPQIIFRDLKPSNLIIDSRGNVRLLDFGAGIKCFDKIRAAHIIGTYGYASKEVLEGKNIGTYSDIYALGAILYYMLTGINPALPPYKLEDIETVSVTVPLDVCRLIKMMTEEDIDKRLLDAKAVLSEIEHIKPDKSLNKAYAGYIVYYSLLFITAAFTGYSIWMCYKSVMPRYGYMFASLVMFITCQVYKHILEKSYDRKHFIRKREINILYTQKRTAGLFTLVSSIFLMTGCIGQNKGDVIEASIINDAGQNVLVKSGYTYDTGSEAKFSVSLDKDCEYEIYVVKKGEGLEADSSRKFMVRY